MYYQFRCTECTLLRCSTDNSVCEECQAVLPVADLAAEDTGLLEAMARAAALAGGIFGGFLWDSTAQGSRFWDGACKELRRLGEGKGWSEHPINGYVLEGAIAAVLPTPGNKLYTEAARLANQLSLAFIWYETEKGSAFWGPVYDALVGLSQGQGWVSP